MIGAILKYSIGSLIYGGLITIAFLALFIFFIKGWYKDAVFRPISIVVLGILSLIVLWNSTIICGALAMKSDITSIQGMIENVIATAGLDRNVTVDLEGSNDIFRAVVDQHPILGYYADYCDFSGWRIAELPGVICETLKDYLNGIIVKALLWSLGFVIVGSVIVIKTMGRRTTASYGQRRGGSRYSDRPGRDSRVSSRITGRHTRRRR